MYVYISDNERFSDFDDKNALFWVEDELQYGDWTSGLAGDGTYQKNSQITVSEVWIPSCYVAFYFSPLG